MAQHDYNIADQVGADFRSDINLVLTSIVSNNSGATEPSTRFPYQWWADTTTGLLKQRNAANTAWVTILDLATGAVTVNANLTGEVTSVGNATTVTNSAVISKLLTGYTSGAGVVAATDTILQAIEKLNGNDATNANLTGEVTSVGNATTVTNSAVISKLLTGYTSGAGTVAATDTILQAIEKLNGNDATNANLTGPITSVGNATSIASQTGTGTTFAMSASPTFTGTVTVPTPSNTTDAATKGYVDALKQALDIKDSVRVASTANITIASALIDGSTIDGVVVATGNRVLLKDQTAPAENGIYTVVASGAASRTTDADISAEVTSGMYVFVSEGTANGSAGFVLTTADPITLGTTALVFTQFSGAGQIIAGTGLSKTGNTLSINTSVTVDLSTSQSLSNKTFVAPVLGTPTSGTLTNCTGLPTNGLVDGAVTYAKIQNVSATDKILGRSTAGAGPVEEIACTAAGRAILDDVDASAQRTTLAVPSTTETQNSTHISLTAVAGTDTITATAPSPFTAYATGQEFSFIASGTNTGAATINLNTVGAVAITKGGGSALIAGDIISGAFIKIKKTATNFELMAGGGSGGGQMLGVAATKGIFYNAQTIDENITVGATQNAMSAGPITVSNGFSVTVTTGGRWLIL